MDIHSNHSQETKINSSSLHSISSLRLFSLPPSMWEAEHNTKIGSSTWQSRIRHSQDTVLDIVEQVPWQDTWSRAWHNTRLLIHFLSSSFYTTLTSHEIQTAVDQKAYILTDISFKWRNAEPARGSRGRTNPPSRTPDGTRRRAPRWRRPKRIHQTSP